jgi:hypothetical protein
MDTERVVAKDSEFADSLYILFVCVIGLYPLLYAFTYFWVVYCIGLILLTYLVVFRNRKNYYRIIFNADSLTIRYLFSSEEREILYNDILQLERKGVTVITRYSWTIDNFFIRTSHENLRIKKSDESKAGVERVKSFWNENDISYQRKDADLKREYHAEDIKYGYYRGKVIPPDKPTKRTLMVTRFILITIGLLLVFFFVYLMSQK